MAHTFTFGKVAKRKNSTLQGAVSASYDVLFKTPTSIDEPTITLNHSGDFDYNYAKYNDNYYFVTDKVSRNNDLWEVSLELDPLATCKSEILNSTQFVTYSSSMTSIWLPDTRIPVQKNATVAQNTTTMNFLFTDGGFYVLSAIGKDGCEVYCTDKANLKRMISEINNWTSDLQTEIFQALPFPTPSDEKEATANLYTVMLKTGIVGNAYTDAPNCIRSCIWVPFFLSSFAEGGGTTIKLGVYDTGATAYSCKTSPVKNTVSVRIPWQFNDWRRGVCEQVYLYLPLVGMVALSSDELINQTSISVEWSATATDGCIAYKVSAGAQVIGTYGANCAVNYPIGISQQASAGEIVQTAMSGIDRAISTAVHSSISPISAVASVGGSMFEGFMAGYDVENIRNTTHNSCIGGIGGGAGVGLSLDLKCFTVAHPTVIEPSQMAATMGLPTMKPMTLSSLSGYCQCANAHVSAAVDAPILNKIDAYLNSGFYIE